MLANIELYPDRVLLSQAQEAGVVSTRTVSPEALAQALSTNAKFDTGMLPCKEGVVRYTKGGNRTLICYLVPEQHRTIFYRDSSLNKDFKNVCTPWTLFMFSLQTNAQGEYAIAEEYVFALKGPLLTGMDTLYKFPFTNVYDGGGICWGNNREHYTWKNLAGFITHIDLFYGSPFNAHLEGGNFVPLSIANGQGKTVTISSTSALFNALQDRTSFPVEILQNFTSFKAQYDRLIRNM